MVNIAVLGCGRIGVMHARNIAKHPRARLATVFDIYQPSADKVAAELGVKTSSSITEVLADPGVDAILIATSTDTHADILEQAVAAGKPILCEKPIDLSLARVNAASRRFATPTCPSCWALCAALIRATAPRAMRCAVETSAICTR